MKLEPNIRGDLEYIGTVEDINPVDDYYTRQERAIQACVAGCAIVAALVLVAVLVIWG